MQSRSFAGARVHGWKSNAADAAPFTAERRAVTADSLPMTLRLR
jgi:hypothetical protein